MTSRTQPHVKSHDNGEEHDMPERPRAGLRLEPHMTPALRAAFDEAVATLTPQLRSFGQDGYIERPWMGDPVSSMVLDAYHVNVAGNPTPARDCLVEYQAELARVRDTLSQMEDDYRRREGDNAALWGGRPDRDRAVPARTDTAARYRPAVQRMLGMAIGLVLVAAAGACSPTPPAGTAAPTTAGASPTMPRPGAITLPPRPRDIPIDAIEPCSLLTEQQQSALGLDGTQTSTSNLTQLLGPARLCALGGFEPRAVTIGISLVATTGIERFTQDDIAAKITPIAVSGFPAVIARPTRFDDYCSVEIDIAAGQLIDVQFANGGRRPGIPQDQLCRDAQDVAGKVMTTLLAR